MPEGRAAPEGVRPLSLKAAAVLGGLVAAIYVVTLPALDEDVAVGVGWVAVMVASASLAWWAAQTARRWAGYTAALGYFVLGVVSSSLPAAIFLIAAFFCFLGSSESSRAR